MYLGIDIGGTKTLIAAFDENGQLTEEVKFPSPPQYEDFLEAVRTNVASFKTHEFKMGAIGMPGSQDRERGISLWSGGNLQWGQRPVAKDLSEVVGCKLLIENDANLAGLGEAILVKDKYHRALYVTVSTGIGGVIVNGGYIEQPTINAEIGHMIYKQPDGSYLTWEQLASGKAIVEKFGQRADEIEDPEIWKAATEPLAAGIINCCMALTPDVVILGGGAGAQLHRYQQYLDAWIESLHPQSIPMPPIIEARRPEEAVVYGAYDLVRQHAGAA